jgi:hypothetical protein
MSPDQHRPPFSGAIAVAPVTDLSYPEPEQCESGSRSVAAFADAITARDAERERERDELETDRDAFTPATTTVGQERLVLESAYSFVDNIGVKDTHSFPESVFRYGLTDRLEMRLGWNADMGGKGSGVSGSDGEDVDPFASNRVTREFNLSYGMKIRLTDQDQWLPRSIAMVNGFTPTGGSTGVSTATQVVATCAAGWELPNHWRFDMAMRYGTAVETGDHFNEWAPSAVVRVPIGERWAVHAEYFGVCTTGKETNSTQNYASTGAHWLVTPELEIGFRVGWGLNEQASRFFTNFGFGCQF